MRWNRFTIKTLPEAEDVIISALSDIGVEGVEIEDDIPLTQDEIEQMYVDMLPEAPKGDGTAKLSFYLDEKEDADEVLRKVREVLAQIRQYMEIGEGTIERGQTEDKDWINNWKEHFHQFRVDDILIVPSWEEAAVDGDVSLILHIDPGTAFGTGMHETTQLVIREIKRLVKPGDLVLDIGTGSGILGITALKFGAAHVFATDLDPCTVNAVEENLAANGIAKTDFTLLLGNLINDRTVQEAAGFEKYDLVISNIQTEVLLPLTPEAIRHMKPEAYYVMSGILAEKEERILECVSGCGLKVENVTRQGEWVCVTVRKP